MPAIRIRRNGGERTSPIHKISQYHIYDRIPDAGEAEKWVIAQEVFGLFVPTCAHPVRLRRQPPGILDDGGTYAPTAARPYYLVEVNMNTRLPQLVDTILHEMAHVAHFCGYQRYRHLPCHFPLFGDRGHCAQWALAADRMLRIFQTMPLHLLPPTTRDFINRMGDFRWAMHLSVYA